MTVPNFISLVLLLSIAILCHVGASPTGGEYELTEKSSFLPDLDSVDAEFSDIDGEEELFSSLRFGFRRRAQTSESSRANIFQKLGESLGTTIVGCCLIALMPCLIWKNEGRHVNELSRIQYCKNNAVAVDW
jgi:hypothetical protein